MTSARTCSKGVCVNLVLQRSARVLVHDLVIFVPARYVSKGRNKFHQTTYQDLSQRKGAKGPFKYDVSREGEGGGGYPNSDAVREVAWI